MIALKVKLFAGTTGTPALPKGAIIRRIVAVGASGATVQMPDGNLGSVTIPVPVAFPHVVHDDGHSQSIRSITGADVIFTSTTSYVVECYIPTGA